MGCCSSCCERYTICALAYESGSVVNWHEYGHGGIDSPEFWYCGPSGNYSMFEPVDPVILENKIAAYQAALDRLKKLINQEEKHEST